MYCVSGRNRLAATDLARGREPEAEAKWLRLKLIVELYIWACSTRISACKHALRYDKMKMFMKHMRWFRLRSCSSCRHQTTNYKYLVRMYTDDMGLCAGPWRAKPDPESNTTRPGWGWGGGGRGGCSHKAWAVEPEIAERPPPPQPYFLIRDNAGSN